MRKVKVNPASELAIALREATAKGESLLLDIGEATYPIQVTPGPKTAADKTTLWDDYDPAKVREAIERYAGSLSEDEAATMIAAVYGAREEGSRPADRP